MKFIFDRDSLLKEMAIAQEIIATKNVTSILSNVLFIAENNSLTIKATDIKVNFETKIPVEIQTEGTTTVFCDKFVGMLNNLPQGEIEFNQENGIVIIKPIAKKIKFQLRSMASDKFPEFASAEKVPYFDVPAAEFKEMITQTIFAVSQDEQRLYMNGVYVEKKGDNLVLVATDSRRLSFISKPLCGGVMDFEPAIVPPKIFNVLLKRLPSEGNLSIAIVDKVIFFKFGNYSFTSVLIDGQYPNYQRVIPESQKYLFEVEKKDLFDALKRVSLFVEQKSNRVYFKLTPGTLAIRSQESEVGDANEEIPCMYDGEEVEMAFNYVFIEEPMKVINSDRLKFEFSEYMKAVTLKSVPEADYFHIIMPMQRE
ncbi:MAG: DNA polymerase III subunit beta [Treponemataceae bacterium]|nr:DNA polymerase III subunit beta [Treponemataceae bacterium]